MERDADAIVARIRQLVGVGALRLTQHAHQEMVEEGITLDDVLQGFGNAVLVENYPDHRRGPCCLLAGRTEAGRPLHVVCSSESPVIVLITVYEPRPPKWSTPFRRRDT